MSEFKNIVRDIFFFKVLEVYLKGSKKVLDVACGQYSPLRGVKRTFMSEGIDIYKPYLKISKQRKIHDKYTYGDIVNLNSYYKDKSFDAVICLDVIEHFTKTDSIKLIKKIEKIAKNKIILMTPNGFYHQDHLEGNPHEEHKSGWGINDFRKLGYRVRGIRGLKYIRGEHASIIYKPWLFWAAVAFISEPLLYFFPSLSYQLLATKNINEKK